MTKAYWIAHVTVTDPNKYKSYMAMAPEAFRRHGARFLARGGMVTTFEGQEFDRHVVIEFDSIDQARACYNSPEYQMAKKERDGACIASVTIVEGIGDINSI
ncbi:hypothetical protein WH96_11425 [Kiloniella spongiae]|uniref:DUF1330 domain-containing protein n=1 Tax=Kiloniella spongiae TaxID=1489064 RepID=A0A0H2MDR8_9PROT|nr:DUF1330 domain-containing protein [Kiloniella spongiae]KLN60361.1 hypothetical protein WH96_11425 [Kiloniella spongiae]